MWESVFKEKVKVGIHYFLKGWVQIRSKMDRICNNDYEKLVVSDPERCFPYPYPTFLAISVPDPVPDPVQNQTFKRRQFKKMLKSFRGVRFSIGRPQ